MYLLYIYKHSVSYSQFRKKIFYRLTMVSSFIRDTSYGMRVEVVWQHHFGQQLWEKIARPNWWPDIETSPSTIIRKSQLYISRGILKFDFIPWQEVEKLEGVKLTSTSKKKESALEPIYILETVSLRVEYILSGRRNDQHWHSWCNWADQNWYKCRCACCPVLCN